MKHNTYIIAEIGINHEGSLHKCIDMVYAAGAANVNAIKLQTIDPDKNYARDTESYKLFQKSRLSKASTKKVFQAAKECKLDYFTTVGDIETAKWVKKLNPSAWKISSGLFTHIPLIEFLSEEKQDLYLSTGLTNSNELDFVIKKLRKLKKKNFSILHCISQYPLKKEESSLSSITRLKQKYNVNIGYSDHTIGTYASCLAICLGAKIIEKHFTFDRNRKGFDHKVSLDYLGLKKLVKEIRLTESMLNYRKPEGLDRDINRKKYLRVLVAEKKIVKGELFTKRNVSIKRVSDNTNGISPLFYDDIIGRKSKGLYKKDSKINKVEIKNGY
mgnify:CR=1 FL=1